MSHADNYGAMESRMHELNKTRKTRKYFPIGVTPRENNVQITYTSLDAPRFAEGKYLSEKERAAMFQLVNSDI